MTRIQPGNINPFAVRPAVTQPNSQASTVDVNSSPAGAPVVSQPPASTEDILNRDNAVKNYALAGINLAGIKPTTLSDSTMAGLQRLANVPEDHQGALNTPNAIDLFLSQPTS